MWGRLASIVGLSVTRRSTLQLHTRSTTHAAAAAVSSFATTQPRAATATAQPLAAPLLPPLLLAAPLLQLRPAAYLQLFNKSCRAFSTQGGASSDAPTKEQTGGGGGGGSGSAASAPAAAAARDARAVEVANELAEALRRLGLAPGVGCALGDGLLEVDVGVLARRRRPADGGGGGGDGDIQEQQIAIDIDTSDGGGAAAATGRGAAMARRRLLEHLGWVWVVVKADDWTSLGASEQARERFASALVHAALDAGGGGGGHGHGGHGHGGGGHVCGLGCSH